MTSETIPFGACAPSPTHVVHIDPAAFRYDPERQVNVTKDGRLWAEGPMDASSTATNHDGQPGNPPDEMEDPYAVPEPVPATAPANHGLITAA